MQVDPASCYQFSSNGHIQDGARLGKKIWLGTDRQKEFGGNGCQQMAGKTKWPLNRQCVGGS